MQCEFSKIELIRLDLSVMDRATKARQALYSQTYNKTLVDMIEQLDKLHEKLNGLIEQADNHAFYPDKAEE